jgi:hypothetical protein
VLGNHFSLLSDENAEILADYILGEKRSINISPRTATFKIALLTYLALDTGNNKSFIKFTALDIHTIKGVKIKKKRQTASIAQMDWLLQSPRDRV